MGRHKASPPAAVRRRIGGAGASAIRWALRVATSIVAWTLLLHLFTFLGIPRPPLPIARPSCLGGRSNSTAANSVVCVCGWIAIFNEIVNWGLNAFISSE